MVKYRIKTTQIKADRGVISLKNGAHSLSYRGIRKYNRYPQNNLLLPLSLKRPAHRILIWAILPL